jgi:hypothetical protein
MSTGFFQPNFCNCSYLYARSKYCRFITWLNWTRNILHPANDELLQKDTYFPDLIASSAQPPVLRDLGGGTGPAESKLYRKKQPTNMSNTV